MTTSPARRCGPLVVAVIAAAASVAALGLTSAGASVFLPLHLLDASVHELGHAVAAAAVGGEVDSVTVGWDAVGHADVAVPRGRVRAGLVAAAGDVALATWGLLLIAAVERVGRTLPLVTCAFVLGAAAWLPASASVRVLLVLATLLLALRLVDMPRAARAGLLFLGSHACLAPCGALLGSGRGRADATALAAAIGIDPRAASAALAAIGIGALALGWSVVLSRRPDVDASSDRAATP